VSSSNSSLKPLSTSPASTAIAATAKTNQVVADGKENQQVYQAEVSGIAVDAEELPSVSKRPKKSRIKPDSLSQAGNLVRDSCDPHTPIWVPGLPYPAQYCIRQTRSLSQKLQVDTIDCIDLDECMFGSQRMTTPKVKQEDSGSENGITSVEVGPKPLRRKSGRRKSGRRSKRRKQQSKQTSQIMSDSTGLTDSNNSDHGILSGDRSEQPVVPIENVSLCLIQSPTNDKPVLMSQQPLGGNNDMVLSSQHNNNDNLLVSSTQPFTGGNNDISMSVSQPPEGNNDIASPVIQEDNKFTGGDHDMMDGSNITTPVAQKPVEGDNNMLLTGQPSTDYDKDLTLYGVTESMLMSSDTEDGGKTVVDVVKPQEAAGGVANSYRFWCEQTDDLHNKVEVIRSDTSATIQHCSVLKVC